MSVTLFAVLDPTWANPRPDATLKVDRVLRRDYLRDGFAAGGRMPIVFGAHILVAGLCAVHIVRTSRPMYWIMIVLMFPWIGSLIYFAAEVLPSMISGRHARAAGQAATKVLDPGREARAALHELEVTRTPANLKRAADALLDLDRPDEALALYLEATDGAFADDPSLLAGRARAEFRTGDPKAAIKSLDALRKVEPNARMPEEHLLYARSLEESGRTDDALKEYRNVAVYYPGAEAYVRWALLLEKLGRDDDAQAQWKHILDGAKIAPAFAKRTQRKWIDMARAHKR